MYTDQLSPMTPEDLDSRTGWGIALCVGIVRALDLSGISLVDTDTVDYVNNKIRFHEDDMR